MIVLNYIIEDLEDLRIRAEKAEADARQARNETVLERESYEQMHDVAIRHRQDSDKWAALAADATARAEKAEAALARYPTSAADAIICKQQMIEQRARADRYLAAMQALIDGYATNPEYLAAVAAIRAIVEEARRG